jgi:dolichol-phosphate mannosyltransferase
VLSQHKPFHILIVDDNSPDHTADRVKLQTEFEGRLFLENREKIGLGQLMFMGLNGH